MSTRDEIFAKSNAKHKQDKQEEERRKNFKFEPVDYSALETGKFKIYRLLGYPMNARNNDPFSAKAFGYSMVLDDNGKKSRFIWPLKEEQPDWIMWRLLNTVLAYDWDATSNSRIYKHKDRFPDIFNRVFKNNNPTNAYEKGYYPSIMCGINAIDREMMTWHKDAKSCILISKRASESNGNWFYEPGIPITLYNNIWDEIVEGSGDWENYDIAITKLDDNPWYRVYHCANRIKDLVAKVVKFDNPILKLSFEKLLTDEERSWKKFNLDDIFKVTSYNKILKRLRGLFYSVDAAFGTKYLDELQQLSENEKILWEKEEKEKANSFPVPENMPSTHVPPPTPSSVSTPVETPVYTPPPVQVETTPNNSPTRPKPSTTEVRPNSGITLESLINKGFLGISKLTDEEKSLIESIRQENDGSYVFTYKKEAGILYKCMNSSNCIFESPEKFHCCPLCSTNF